ncbi:unnamed protein product [Zymoseptoria tritici ST99CH_3D7]|uniref:Uncharacterized protein n=1 Tax=Zymoseptoria tritici (strain ST99CH_3D7) TaxID=1276538 RepID=A0A1X7RRW9_ZYMT9|nr:unnamed protein product [Zymoseptoria tritici ST99CH_3D7]
MKLFFLTIGLFLAAAMAAPTADPARTPDQPPPGGRLIKPFTCAPGVSYYNLCDRGSKQVRCTVTSEEHQTTVFEELGRFLGSDVDGIRVRCV